MLRSVVVSAVITGLCLSSSASARPVAVAPRAGQLAAVQASFLDEERQANRAIALSSADPLLASGALARALGLYEHEEDPAARDAFVDAVIQGARSPLAAAHARRQRALDRANAGAFDDAGADLDALGHPTALACIGPFGNTGGGALGQPTAADDVKASFSRSVPGLDRPVQWRSVPRDVRGGFDVGSRFVARREVRALCAAVVEVKGSRSPVPAALRLGSSGQLRVLVNGAEVLRDDVDRPFGFDQSAALVSLVPGKNLIVVELGMFGRGGVVDVRITAPDGQPLPRAQWSADLKDAPTTTTTTKAPRATLAFAVPSADGDLAQLRASVAVAQRARGFDHRARPTQLEQLLAILVEKAPSKQEKASAEVRLGSEIMGRDKTAARRWLEAAALDDPSSASPLSALAGLKAELGDGAEASRLHAQAVLLEPRSVVYRAERFEHERQRGALGPLIDAEILKAAAKTSSTRLLRLAADVLDDRGDHSGAVALLKRSGRDVGAFAVARGEVVAAQLGAPQSTPAGAHDELLRLLRLRLRLSPGSHALAERTLLHLQDGKDAAVAVNAFVDERRALYPDRPEPLALAARAALIKGDRVAARALLQEAQERAPEDGDLQRVVRALADDDDALARWLPPFDVKAARGPLPAGAAELGAHVHNRTLATRFFDNGQVRSLEDTVVVVHDAKRAAGFRTFHFSYSGGREQVEVLVAERVTRDGRTEPATRVVDRGQDGKENGMYSDARTKTVVFAVVDDGDVLHLRVRKEATGLQNLFGDFFGDLEAFQGRYPSKQFRSVVEAPLSRPLYWGGRGAPEPVVTEEKDTRVYDFVANDVAGVDGEAGMPPWLEIGRYLSLSTYKTWGDLGVWYEDLVRDQLRLDDDLKRVAKELRAASTSDADLVRRTYEYVVTQTRYVGIELGIHGWKPYPVSEVHRRRFGDCKDKASLLVALLREEGIAAHLALVRTIQLGHEGSAPPSMWAFNHAIAFVPSLELFLDGTAEHSGWHELPTSDQGALSLIVDGKDSRLVTIPVRPADNNLNTSDYVLTLQPDGALVVDGTERFQGHHNAEQRRAFADPATRKETLERQLSSFIAGAAVAAVDVSSLALAEEETQYRFQAVLPKRAGVDADGTLVMPLSLYPHDLAGNYAEQSSRRYPLFFDHPWRTRNVMRYVLPRGYELAELPKGGVVNGDHVRFTQTITRTKDGFVIDEDTAIVVRRVPLEEYDRFRKDALAADKLMKRTLRIVKKDGA